MSIFIAYVLDQYDEKEMVGVYSTLSKAIAAIINVCLPNPDGVKFFYPDGVVIMKLDGVYVQYIDLKEGEE